MRVGLINNQYMNKSKDLVYGLLTNICATHMYNYSISKAFKFLLDLPIINRKY